MKRKILLAIIFFMCGFFISFVLAKTINKDGTYERQAVVSEIKNNETVFEDKAGNSWSCGSCEFDEGQKVILLMSDNKTKSIYDDRIVDVIE